MTDWTKFSTRRLRRALHRYHRTLWLWSDRGYRPEGGGMKNEMNAYSAIRAELERRGEFV